MQVDMEDFLKGGFSIRQEEVHPFTFYSTHRQGECDFLSDTKKMGAGIFIQVGQASRVLVGNNQHMAGIHRLYIHEGSTGLIMVYQAGWNFICQDVTEDAIVHIVSPQAELI